MRALDEHEPRALADDPLLDLHLLPDELPAGGVPVVALDSAVRAPLRVVVLGAGALPGGGANTTGRNRMNVSKNNIFFISFF